MLSEMTKKPTYVCVYDDYGTGENIQKANATFIVKAVNSHDQLVRAVTSAKRLIGAINDTASAAIKESNINTAWHILDDALATLKDRS